MGEAMETKEQNSWFFSLECYLALTGMQMLLVAGFGDLSDMELATAAGRIA